MTCRLCFFNKPSSQDSICNSCKINSFARESTGVVMAGKYHAMNRKRKVQSSSFNQLTQYEALPLPKISMGTSQGSDSQPVFLDLSFARDFQKNYSKLLGTPLE